ncbi:unnamed protein product [Cyprideis torosa]|uniref:Uncharacterized protein n=1 Tax=Cyprideis torosa TaxID=163714 RepID=A0A7R8WQ56_9CRUS|nr:unnamed protein product [Cyprideis torosa]CAG0902338.1 unnamed protein product [Cyprideis torosa]
MSYKQRQIAAQFLFPANAETTADIKSSANSGDGHQSKFPRLPVHPLDCIMFSLAVVSLCLGVSAALPMGEYPYEPKAVVLEEKTIGRAYSDTKVKQDKDSYYYSVVGKDEQDQGNGKEYSDQYRHVSAKIIPKGVIIVDDHYGHKKEIVDYEVPFKAEWGIEQKLPIVQRTEVLKEPVIKVVEELVPYKYEYGAPEPYGPSPYLLHY